MYRGITIGVLVVFFSGCGAIYVSCRYAPVDVWGVGYKVSPIQDDLYSISYTGSQNDNIQRIKDFALIRSADTTLESNYKYFVILDNQTGSTSYGTSGSMYGTINASGQNKTINSTGYAVTQTRISIAYTIKCLNTKPENATVVIYDAAQVNKNMKKAYGIQ